MTDVKHRRVDEQPPSSTNVTELRDFLVRCESALLSSAFFGDTDEQRARLVRQVEALEPLLVSQTALERTVAWYIFNAPTFHGRDIYVHMGIAVASQHTLALNYPMTARHRSDFAILLERLRFGGDESSRAAFYSKATPLVLARVPLSVEVKAALDRLSDTDAWWQDTARLYELTYVFGDPTRGTIEYFLPKSMRDIAKVALLAFASDKDRASLCSVDKHTAALCRRERNNIAEYQFVYMFRSEETITALRERREAFFGGVGKPSEWADYYRACVAAVTFASGLQDNDDYEDYGDYGTARGSFVSRFGLQSGAARAALLPAEARPNGPTREDRRFRTARMVLWWLHWTGRTALCEALFGETFNDNDMFVADFVNADGTAYDGAPYADKIVRYANGRNGALEYYLALFCRDRDVAAHLQRQLPRKELWIQVLGVSFIRPAATVNIAFWLLLERSADLTENERKEVEERLTTALVDAYGRIPQVFLDAATRSSSLVVWESVLRRLQKNLQVEPWDNAHAIFPLVLQLAAKNGIVPAQGDVSQLSGLFYALFMRLIRVVVLHGVVSHALQVYKQNSDIALWKRALVDLIPRENVKATLRALQSELPEEATELRAYLTEWLVTKNK